ncbi:hypothetical protein [Ruegeria sp. HKCCD8929]|uniref:hypothetical protein n=1 Tax=Ruegeria sp. HKCCD8929 TaxID=2683006 RepID=UPI001489A868|nr:hypothetical protein [Ruegeria sp. HKCCD8929]
MNMKAGFGAVAAVLALSVVATTAGAQDLKVPKKVRFKDVPEPMQCSTPVNPFTEPFHTKGQRSRKTKIKGTLFIICPTRLAVWNGHQLPINWFDARGNGYTDCEIAPDGSHKCWVTLPK